MMDKEKIDFKLKESVTLELDSIYVRCKNKNEAKEILEFVDPNNYGSCRVFKKHFDLRPNKVYKFYITDEAYSFIRNEVVSKLPKGWLSKQKHDWCGYGK